MFWRRDTSWMGVYFVCCGMPSWYAELIYYLMFVSWWEVELKNNSHLVLSFFPSFFLYCPSAFYYSCRRVCSSNRIEDGDIYIYIWSPYTVTSVIKTSDSVTSFRNCKQTMKWRICWRWSFSMRRSDGLVHTGGSCPASGPGSDCSGGERVASLLSGFRVK